MKIEELHKSLPNQLPVEITDAIQFFLRSNADQQMRFVIHLEKQININILQKAVRLTIYQEPIFSYTYKEDKNLAYWQKQSDIEISSLVDLVESADNPDIEIDKFLTTSTSPFEFPLVKVRVIRYDKKDILCINMNHTPTDGAGLKEFTKILANNYNKLIENPDYVCQANTNGDRSIKQITDNFSVRQKFKFIKLGFKRPPKRIPWSFDWEKTENDNKKQFALVKIPSETFNTIKTFGKNNKATVNDIVITAFIRSFVKTNQNKPSVSKPLIVPVNLRKYLKPGHKSAICSLTGSMIINMGNEIGGSFEETLKKVVEETAFKKSTNAEMNMLFPFIVMNKLMPYVKLKEKIMNRKMPPIPLLTNIGIIDPTDINFNNIPVENSYVTGVVSYGNYFTMGYSTFNKEMTFSIGFCGSDLQKQKVNTFLNEFKSELERIK